MYALVADARSYPAFLPWCRGADVRDMATDEVEATLHIEFRGIRQRFTTRNRLLPESAIELNLVDGPFRSLDGRWTFTALETRASKVSLALSYEFASGVLEHLVGPAFSIISSTLVDAFVKRADALGDVR
jgi:ribosome-associated toxin RatA of RatAB toxin-antitoxin module